MNKNFFSIVFVSAFILILGLSFSNVWAQTKTPKKKDVQATQTKKKDNVKKAPAAKDTQAETGKSVLESYAQGAKPTPKPAGAKVRASSEKAKEQEIITTVGGKTRIDFSDMLIEGQTKKADTVYLFERTESKIDSLVKIRKDFRQEIMESYLE